MAMSTTTVPNIDTARDHGFLLDTGETVVVRVEQASQQPDGDAIAVRIQARMVNSGSGATLKVGGNDVMSSAHIATIMNSALADGTLTIATLLADRMASEALRPRAMKAALTSFLSIAPASGSN